MLFFIFKLNLVGTTIDGSGKKGLSEFQTNIGAVSNVSVKKLTRDEVNQNSHTEQAFQDV